MSPDTTASPAASSPYRVSGDETADFTLTAYRGDGMVLLAMNWRTGEPPLDFVGFAIHCTSPGVGHTPQPLRNLLTFPKAVDASSNSASDNSPFQRFRWVHFPEAYYEAGVFVYDVVAMHMAADHSLTKGDSQRVSIELGGETYPGLLDVTFTRGFISSQAYVRNFKTTTGILPSATTSGLAFTSSNPGALAWMGFGDRYAMFEALDRASTSPDATVDVIAYDLDEKEVVDRLAAFGPRLRIIIDDSADHGLATSPESLAAARFRQSAGVDHVVRQHLGDLQHNKMIVVRGTDIQLAVCGSTNFSWRGLYVQNNNLIVLRTAAAVAPFGAAFDAYFLSRETFRSTPQSTGWTSLGLPGIDATVTFSPHSGSHSVLNGIAQDIASAKSSVFYSLAFLYQTTGVIMDAINTVTNNDDLFVYGISDKKVGGLLLHKGADNPVTVYPASLVKGKTPYPFSVEPTLNGGVQMHHKFVVIDANTPDARVYVGSFNFSTAADTSNGENLLLIRDAKIASSFLVEALSMFDHYSYRIKNDSAPLPGEKGVLPATLQPAPSSPSEEPWWKEYFVPGQKQRDRLLFA